MEHSDRITHVKVAVSAYLYAKGIDQTEMYNVVPELISDLAHLLLHRHE